MTAAGRNEDGDAAADEVVDKRRQPVGLAIGPAVFDRHVLAFDITGLTKPLAKCIGEVGKSAAVCPLRNPITGIAGCCARAASGHAAAAPPSSVMNERRFIQSPRRRATGTILGSSIRAPWRW